MGIYCSRYVSKVLCYRLRHVSKIKSVGYRFILFLAVGCILLLGPDWATQSRAGEVQGCDGVTVCEDNVSPLKGPPHLSAAPPVGPLAGGAGPVAVAVAVVRVPVGVVLAVVALLVHGAMVVVMVVVVVPAVLGPAPLPLTLLGRQLRRLGGGAEVGAQAWRWQGMGQGWC